MTPVRSVVRGWCMLGSTPEILRACTLWLWIISRIGLRGRSGPTTLLSRKVDALSMPLEPVSPEIPVRSATYIPRVTKALLLCEILHGRGVATSGTTSRELTWHRDRGWNYANCNVGVTRPCVRCIRELQ